MLYLFPLKLPVLCFIYFNLARFLSFDYFIYYVKDVHQGEDWRPHRVDGAVWAVSMIYYLQFIKGTQAWELF
jgi:hypothetical protein